MVDILLALAPKNSLNSLSIVFELFAGCGGDVVVRGSLAPRPQGSDIFTERPVPLSMVVWWLDDHGLAWAFDEDAPFCHGSLLAELRPFGSDDQGSSTKTKGKVDELWRREMK